MASSGAPVIGETNERGVPNNEWDVYWWQQAHKNDTTNPAGSSGAAAQSGVQMYGAPEEVQGEAAARNNASIYYGTTDQLGADAQDYRNKIKSKVGQPSGLANRMIQSSNQDISRANAKAGLYGVDTTAASIREKRNAIGKANEIDQSQDAINMSNYGKSISAGISGTEALAAAGAGRGIASKPGETPSYGGGLLGSIICTELYRQKKLTLRELVGCREFGEEIGEEAYRGYLTIAKPIVKLMKRSDKFSDLFIGWAKSISEKKPNAFTRFMLPICTLIGKLNVKVAIYARQS